jgi:gliding motility-associated lipoprotein GldH
MAHGKKNLLLLLVFMGFIISCDRNRFFEENTIMKDGIWNSRQKVSYSVTIDDLLSRYNIYITLRNAPEYPYSNLFLFLNTTYPDGKTGRDTLELSLADYDGRWLGSGMGSVKYNRFLFLKDFQFRSKGTYKFEFEQGMRVNDLKGIRDFGLRIEK